MAKRQEILNRMCQVEDTARGLRNSIGASGLPYVSADIVQELANQVAQLAQVVREGLVLSATAAARKREW